MITALWCRLGSDNFPTISHVPLEKNLLLFKVWYLKRNTGKLGNRRMSLVASFLFHKENDRNIEIIFFKNEI